MAGRIRDEDIALVRERSPIDDVVGEHVQLRNAGGGNLKGICPFHDEKSPSFNVTPSRGMFYCFGCQAGGDVIKFVQDVEHVEFVEAVEKLAARAGVQLRYVDGAPSDNRNHGQRARLIEAHKAAAEFYAEQLTGAEARPAREFLAQRGFDQLAAARFGCGYAPSGWDALTRHLRGRGFTAKELEDGGLARQGSRSGLIDRFHRRLLWPIREVNGEVVGFGARRIFDDDRIEAKYLNTGETPIYKKSHLLYGADLARRAIARKHQAVIVEGYTDVMACHLAGVETAVATCGTAFGNDHVSVLRRLLMDSDATGEVIFTFDGDAAGRKAAERAFSDDQKFMAQTFIAVEQNGMDPCELRMASGDTAVLDLVARRIPLVEFVLRETVGRFDLDTAEGRSGALDKSVPMVAQIKDRGIRDEYARRLSGLIGFSGSSDDEARVIARVRGLVRSDDRKAGTPAPPVKPAEPERVQVDETVVAVEREVLKVALQLPAVAGPEFDALTPDAFLVPEHRSVRSAIADAGGTKAALTGPAWTAAIEAHLADDRVRRGVQALTVQPLRSGPEGQERYAAAMLARLHEVVAGRQISVLKSRLQRMNPLEQPDEHARLFGELIALEALRRNLRERAIGGS